MKKILFVFPIVAFLAAGCNSSQQAQNQTPVVQNTNPTSAPNNIQAPAPTPPASTSPPSANPLDLLATVNVSGSTNTLPYSIKIFADGSASVFIQNQSERDFKTGTVNTVTFANLLQKVGDVSQITGSCSKSASFGTITTITYNDKTSGDISCTFTGNVYSLYQFISQTQSQLGLEKYVSKKPVVQP
jgi:hypothetical protein